MKAVAELSPYLILILVGFLPNEIWRMIGLAASRGIDDGSEILVWVRAVATAILTGVVGKLVLFAPGSLGEISVWVRLGAAALGMLAFYALGRSVLAAVATGTSAIALGMLLGGG
jgi:hypothetical protein